MLQWPFKRSSNEHETHGISRAPWKFNVAPGLCEYSVILAPPFLNEKPTEELVKKYVKTLNLEIGTYEDILPDSDLETVNIYPEIRKSYLYDVTGSFFLLSLMIALYKRNALYNSFKSWKNA